MGLSDRPAERHRQVAASFTEKVHATQSWDTPSPVEGWTARDIVGHLTQWLPSFLAAGAGRRVRLTQPAILRPPAGRAGQLNHCSYCRVVNAERSSLAKRITTLTVLTEANVVDLSVPARKLSRSSE